DAVKQFQRAMGLPPTGVADAATQGLLKVENDQRYAVLTSESAKLAFRQLVAGLGNDAARIDGVVELLNVPSFASLPKHGHELIAEALAGAEADPAFAANLTKLLKGDDFQWVGVDERLALLAYVKNHADAATAGKVEQATHNDKQLASLVELAGKE